MKKFEFENLNHVMIKYKIMSYYADWMRLINNIYNDFELNRLLESDYTLFSF